MSQSTWTGAVSSDWNDPDNWSPAGVPGVGLGRHNNHRVVGRLGLDRDGQFDQRFVRPLLRVGGNECSQNFPGQHRLPER
jgi:hypothetical protein